MHHDVATICVIQENSLRGYVQELYIFQRLNESETKQGVEVNRVLKPCEVTGKLGDIFSKPSMSFYSLDVSVPDILVKNRTARKN